MMQPWFQDAKLGIFMHWGLYSVKGIPESWSFYRDELSYEDYMGQAAGFTAARYDPTHWAAVFQRAGAKYTVLTAKHHDGFALWDTQASALSAPKMTPAGRDLIAPYCNAMRAAGLKVGLYFSHLDWSHPDNNAVINPDTDLPFNRYTYPDGPEDPARWANFLRFHRAQLRELMTNYGDIDLMWFDGDWEKTAEQWDMLGIRAFLHSLNPNVVLNSRMLGYGDYDTPEQGYPVADPGAAVWEYGITMNDSWGYQIGDDRHKPVSRLIRLFTEIIGRGGNMLLGIGPMADGTLQPEQESRLLALGDWLRPVAEAVYGSTKGLGYRHYTGPSTLSADRQSVYLFAHGEPGELFVRGIRNPVKRAVALHSGKELTVDTMLGAPWNDVPPTLWIDLAPEDTAPHCTVVKLELDGDLDLYTGKSGAIAIN